MRFLCGFTCMCVCWRIFGITPCCRIAVVIPWRYVCGAACGVCGRVAVWRGVASYMWIEVRTMCMRPHSLLVVVWRLYDVYFPIICDTSVLHAI